MACFGAFWVLFMQTA